jgi:hypothetical protein
MYFSIKIMCCTFNMWRKWTSIVFECLCRLDEMIDHLKVKKNIFFWLKWDYHLSHSEEKKSIKLCSAVNQYADVTNKKKTKWLKLLLQLFLIWNYHTMTLYYLIVMFINLKYIYLESIEFDRYIKSKCSSRYIS